MVREACIDDQGFLRIAALKEWLEPSGIREHGDDVERRAGRKTVPERERRVIGRRVDDRESHVPDVGADRIAEENDLHHRHEDDHDERSPVAEDVVDLFPQQSPQCLHCAAPGAWDSVVLPLRASRTKSSSIVSTSN